MITGLYAGDFNKQENKDKTEKILFTPGKIAMRGNTTHPWERVE